MTSSPDTLALFERIAQTFNLSLDLDEVLNRVLDEVVAVTCAERGFLMLRGAKIRRRHLLREILDVALRVCFRAILDELPAALPFAQ